MSSDPPPPYPGGPAAPLMEEKRGQPPFSENVPTVNQPMGTHFPPSECGPPPYEPSMHPGQVPPHIPSEGGIAYPPPGYYPPPGQFPTPGPYPPPPGQFQPVGAHTPALIVPAATTTTVTVLQGEVFQAAPVHTVCPHCQQAIITKISYEIGLMNTLFCLFCCFVGCDLGCCLVPCIIDDLKDVTHTCPNCKAYIYTYKRMC